MTSTVTTPRAASEITAPAPSPTRSAQRGHSPMRPASRFPAATSRPAAAHVRVRWNGADGDLHELVRDHALAVGIDLVDAAAPGAVAGDIVDEAALSTGQLPSRRAGTPVIVVCSGTSSSPGEAETIGADVWRLALAAGAHVLLRLPEESELLLSHLAELTRPGASTTVFGVAGGCGGAGASSFAARLAAAARRHGPVTLIDADPLGGGLDLLVEAPDPSGIRWSDTSALGPDDGESLREGLPAVDEVRLLVAGDGPGPDRAALQRVLTALGPLGGVAVVDLGADLVPAALSHLDHLLLVVPGTDHAIRSAARRLRSWQLPAGLTDLVARRRAAVSPVEVAHDLDLPLAGSFRDCPAGVVPLLDVRRRGADRLCRDLLRDRLAGAEA